MRIGFDAKRAFHNHRGLGNYSRSLIQGLARLKPEWDLELYSPGLKKNSNHQWIKNFKNIHPHYGPISGFTSSVWRSFFLGKSINQDQIDIFHGLSHELPFGTKTKQVVTVHDLLWHKIPENFSIIDRNIYKVKLSKALDQADCILAISEQTKNDLIEVMNVNEDKIKVHYQPCNEFFQTPYLASELKSFQDQLSLPENFVSSVGAIEENKNTLYVVEVFEKALDHFPDLKLVLVGNGGPYKKKVFDYIESKGIRESIYYFPYLETAALKAVYQSCKAFIFPSHYEGFGLPIIEALWLKRAVLASDQENMREAGGPGCYYIDPNRVDSGVEALVDALSCESKTLEMIERGHSHVQRFHWDDTTQNLIKIYSSLL